MIHCVPSGVLRIRTLLTLRGLNTNMSINQVIWPLVTGLGGHGDAAQFSVRQFHVGHCPLVGHATKFNSRKSDQKFWTLRSSCHTSHASPFPSCTLIFQAGRSWGRSSKHFESQTFTPKFHRYTWTPWLRGLVHSSLSHHVFSEITQCPMPS